MKENKGFVNVTVTQMRWKPLEGGYLQGSLEK